VSEAPSPGHRPTAQDLAVARVPIEPWRLLTSPVPPGVENVPTDRPALLVVNHTPLSVLEVPLMVLA